MFQSPTLIVGIVIVLSLMVLSGIEHDKHEWCEKHRKHPAWTARLVILADANA